MSSSASPFAIFGNAFAHLCGVIDGIANASISEAEKCKVNEVQVKMDEVQQSMNQAMEIRRQAEEAEEQRKAEEKRQAEEAEEQRKAEVKRLEGEVAAKNEALTALMRRAAALHGLMENADDEELTGLQAMLCSSETKIDNATAALAKAEEDLAAVQPAAPLPVPSDQPTAVQPEPVPVPSAQQTVVFVRLIRCTDQCNCSFRFAGYQYWRKLFD
jgi:hypothetical protein